VNLLFANCCNDVFCTEVREPNCGQELAYLVVALEVQIFNLESFLAAQRVEVLEREHADVRRIVPFVGEFLRFRHTSVEHEASASCPMPKVREGDNNFLSHAQKLVQQRNRIADFLNRAVDDGVIKTSVLDVLEPAFVEVALDDLYVIFKAIEDSLDVLFDAKSRDLLFMDQVIQ